MPWSLKVSEVIVYTVHVTRSRISMRFGAYRALDFCIIMQKYLAGGDVLNSYKKYTKEYQDLSKDFDCGNYVLNKFLMSSDALDKSQGITYILHNCEKRILEVRKVVGIMLITLCSTKEGYKLYHERNSYEDFEDDMNTVIDERDIGCYKLYKCIDDMM